MIAETRPEFVNAEVISPFMETLDDGSGNFALLCNRT